jgi:hypothetical protein
VPVGFRDHPALDVIEIRGHAEALAYGGEVLGLGFSAELIRVYPRCAGGASPEFSRLSSG